MRLLVTFIGLTLPLTSFAAKFMDAYSSERTYNSLQVYPSVVFEITQEAYSGLWKSEKTEIDSLKYKWAESQRALGRLVKVEVKENATYICQKSTYWVGLELNHQAGCLGNNQNLSRLMDTYSCIEK
jgi:hypothetical protein